LVNSGRARAACEPTKATPETTSPFACLPAFLASHKKENEEEREEVSFTRKDGVSGGGDVYIEKAGEFLKT
jgi:hypothetical protein